MILVIRNADITDGGGNGELRATVVVKGGGTSGKAANSNFQLVGGLFVDKELDLSGGFTPSIDKCAVDNQPPGGTPKIDVSDYLEYDSA